MKQTKLIIAVGSYIGALVSEQIEGVIDSLYNKIVEFTKEAMRICHMEGHWDEVIVSVFHNDQELIRQIQLFFDKTPAFRKAVKVIDMLAKTKILWFSSDSQRQFYLCKTLESLGIEVNFAESVQAAVSGVISRKYNVVISPLNEEGLHLLERVNPMLYTTKFIFYPGEITQNEEIPQGAVGIKNRPDEFLSFIFEVIGRKKGQ